MGVPFCRRKKYPGRLDKASVPGYTKNRFGALPPRRSAPIGHNSAVTMLTVRMRAGRSTRCRRKYECTNNDNDPNNDMDHDSVNASHVVTPFRKGVSQPPYFVAAIPQALAPSMYTRSARPEWDMSIVLYSAGSVNNRRKKCPGRLDKASMPGYTRGRFGALPPRRSAPE